MPVKSSAPPAPGVYLLFRKRQLVYVGRSQNPAGRIEAHRRNGRAFDYALQLACPPGDVAWIETAMIAALNPPQNRLGVVTPREEAPDEIVRLVVQEVRPPPEVRDPRETMPLHAAEAAAQRFGLGRLCRDALRSGKLPSAPANPARTATGGKRLVTRGDLDTWVVAQQDQRMKSGWRA